MRFAVSILIALLVAALIAVALRALRSLLLPVFRFDPPTGPHAVGTVTFAWTDPARLEVRSQDPAARRALVVQFWYPAAPAAGAQYTRYVDAVLAEGMARAVRLPAFVFRHLARVSTHAVEDAPLAPGDAPFPVLLFSHGLSTYRSQSTFQVEELASHGYVVAAIQHTYDAAFTLFPNGTGVPYVAAGDRAGLAEWRRQTGARLHVWVEDARFVLDQLATLQNGDPRFAGRLDLERVGYLGHSFGGAAALATLAVEPRLQAGLNMDGTLFGEAADARPRQPFLLMTGEIVKASRAFRALVGATMAEAEAYLTGTRQEWERLLTESPGPRYRLEMEDVKHHGFCDVPLLAPLVFRGATPPRAVHRVVNEYTLAFFDTHLKGTPSSLLNEAAPGPGRKLTRWPGGRGVGNASSFAVGTG